MKERFKIPALRSIQSIMEDFDFLQYCTQKRNLAYQSQFLEFLNLLYKYYEIDRGLRGIFIRHIVICTTNIVEYLLYISLCQAHGIKIKHDNVNNLISQAKRIGLISKQIGTTLRLLVEKRNKLHPGKQIELDVKDFSEIHLQNCLQMVSILVDKLSSYYKPKRVKIDHNYQEVFCEYCFPGGPFGDPGDVCPGCGRYVV